MNAAAMKIFAGKIIPVQIAVLCLVGGPGLVACSSLGIYPSVKGWPSGVREEKGRMEPGKIRVDKTAGRDSVEAEVERLLPLLLAEEGYAGKARMPEENGLSIPGYRVESFLVEREYTEGWKTRRSLSAEILIWKSGVPEGDPPLAAGKAVLLGSKSLSSSKVLYDLLRRALSRALRALPG
ncbi:MAG: hypothetical protein LBD31_04890 [Treponema sp.]|jgi:hypothetical protein|nr:hypothetical protein [Treponema sp.]